MADAHVPRLRRAPAHRQQPLPAPVQHRSCISCNAQGAAQPKLISMARGAADGLSPVRCSRMEGRARTCPVQAAAGRKSQRASPCAPQSHGAARPAPHSLISKCGRCEAGGKDGLSAPENVSTYLSGGGARSFLGKSKGRGRSGRKGPRPGGEPPAHRLVAPTGRRLASECRVKSTVKVASRRMFGPRPVTGRR